MKKNTNNVQDAISDLAALRPNWTLLADTLPAEFLQQVKGEIESLAAQRDALSAELAALKKRVADADVIRVHACMSNGIARYLAPQMNVSEPGRYALVLLEDGEK